MVSGKQLESRSAAYMKGAMQSGSAPRDTGHTGRRVEHVFGRPWAGWAGRGVWRVQAPRRRKEKQFSARVLETT
jgi:hypothetical protein